jgi:hypothetical protein
LYALNFVSFTCCIFLSFSFVSSLFIEQYTLPSYGTIDLRHYICPSCDAPPPPTPAEVLTETLRHAVDAAAAGASKAAAGALIAAEGAVLLAEKINEIAQTVMHKAKVVAGNVQLKVLHVTERVDTAVSVAKRVATKFLDGLLTDSAVCQSVCTNSGDEEKVTKTLPLSISLPYASSSNSGGTTITSPDSFVPSHTFNSSTTTTTDIATSRPTGTTSPLPHGMAVALGLVEGLKTKLPVLAAAADSAACLYKTAKCIGTALVSHINQAATTFKSDQIKDDAQLATENANRADNKKEDHTTAFQLQRKTLEQQQQQQQQQLAGKGSFAAAQSIKAASIAADDDDEDELEVFEEKIASTVTRASNNCLLVSKVISVKVAGLSMQIAKIVVEEVRKRVIKSAVEFSLVVVQGVYASVAAVVRSLQAAHRSWDEMLWVQCEAEEKRRAERLTRRANRAGTRKKQRIKQVARIQPQPQPQPQAQAEPEAEPVDVSKEPRQGGNTEEPEAEPVDVSKEPTERMRRQEEESSEVPLQQQQQQQPTREEEDSYQRKQSTEEIHDVTAAATPTTLSEVDEEAAGFDSHFAPLDSNQKSAGADEIDSAFRDKETETETETEWYIDTEELYGSRSMGEITPEMSDRVNHEANENECESKGERRFTAAQKESDESESDSPYDDDFDSDHTSHSHSHSHSHGSYNHSPYQSP